MRRYIVIGPAVEPLTLAEAKRWLRVDHGDDDGLILSLVKAARERIEARTGRAVMAQTWRIVMDQWPEDLRVGLPVMPVLSVTAVRLLDAAGVASLLASALYGLEPGTEPPVLALKNPPSPGRIRNGIEIDVVAGYGAQAADCPEPLRQATRLLLLDAYGAREPRQDGQNLSQAVVEAERLITPYRHVRIGRALLAPAA